MSGSRQASMRNPVHEVLNDNLGLSARDVAHAITLPPRCYTSPEFYEFEKQAIFAQEWICLGRVEQVPEVGDWYSITVIDEPLVVTRSSESEIRVMSSVCRHRCNVITARGEAPAEEWSSAPPETTGHGRYLRCPYHFWTYDLTGQLVTAPAMEKTVGFDPSEIRLPNLKCEVWNGFIFASFNPDIASLATRLKTLAEMLQNWHLESMRSGAIRTNRNMPWNWKVMHENSIEAYHVDRLHQGVHAVLPSSTVIPVAFDDDDAAIILRHRATHRDYSLNPTYKALLPFIETLTDEEREVSIFALIPPTLLIGMNVDSALYRIVLPAGPEAVNLTFGNLFPETHFKERRYQEIQKMATAGLLLMTSQDFPTDAAVQKGLRSRFACRGRYSWQENTLPDFNRWLVKRYREAGESINEGMAPIIHPQ